MRLVGNTSERKYAPQTMLDAQMSMPYSVAIALTDGIAYLDQFSEERYKDTEVLELARKVKVSIDPELDKLPSSDLSTILNLKLTDGRKINKRIDFFKGDFRNPLTQEEVEEKFKRCARKVLQPETVDQLLKMIMNGEKQKNVGSIFASFPEI